MECICGSLVRELVGVNRFCAGLGGSLERDHHGLAFAPLLDGKFVGTFRERPYADVIMLIRLLGGHFAVGLHDVMSCEHVPCLRRPQLFDRTQNPAVIAPIHEPKTLHSTSCTEGKREWLYSCDHSIAIDNVAASATACHGRARPGKARASWYPKGT